MEDVIMQSNLEINKTEGVVLISVNPKIYPLDVVFSAAYMFIDTCYVLIDGDPLEEIVVELRRKKSETDVEKLGREFNTELVSYANYAIQSLKTAKVRDAIVDKITGKSDSKNYLEKEAKPWKDTPAPWEETDGQGQGTDR